MTHLQLPDVQQAARLPSIIGALLQILNGVVFVGEGIQQGNQAFVSLAVTTAVASLGMLGSLRYIAISAVDSIKYSVSHLNIFIVSQTLRDLSCWSLGKLCSL